MPYKDIEDRRSCGKRYYNSVKGWRGKLYSRLNQNCKRRNMPPPTFTKEELNDWIRDRENLLTYLFAKWEGSGRNKWLKPSINRLDDFKTYSIDNIELTTWQDNYEKSLTSQKKIEAANKNLKFALLAVKKPVIQMDLEGNVIKEYNSMADAGKDNGIFNQNICSVLKGKSKTSHGYKWKYAGLK